ncbi:spore germination protein [Peribacillus butanolivorans]
MPFPHIIDILILEFTIELLRETGASMPTKIGKYVWYRWGYRYCGSC